MSKLQEKACSLLHGDDRDLIKFARYSESSMSRISPIPPRTLQRGFRVALWLPLAEV